jgi:hypothetical protein
MKSGTTTLFRWLEELDDVSLPSVKEPVFFSDEKTWGNGTDWYRALFAMTAPEALTGEASVEYTDPALAGKAAARIAATIPDARLVCLLRDPIARLRSHYRHEVQRSRERLPFLVAIEEPDNPYVRRSMYHSALAPYLDHFDRGQLLVVRMERMTEPPHGAWDEILTHVGAAYAPPPGGAVNVTAAKQQFTRPMLALWKSGMLDRFSRLAPAGARKLGKRILLRDDSAYRELLATADHAVPAVIEEPIRQSASQLQTRLGIDLGFSSAS